MAPGRKEKSRRWIKTAPSKDKRLTKAKQKQPIPSKEDKEERDDRKGSRKTRNDKTRRFLLPLFWETFLWRKGALIFLSKGVPQKGRKGKQQIPRSNTAKGLTSKQNSAAPMDANIYNPLQKIRKSNMSAIFPARTTDGENPTAAQKSAP
jgi:hypothetical protein